MRLRTLKPGFFENEDLAALPPHARLLFAGLWCLADRDGRLEDRPSRIKARVFPYEDVPVDDLLNQLAAVGFISRYECEQVKAIQIVNWFKHQKPHPREAPSTIPSNTKALPRQDQGHVEPGGILSLGSCHWDLGSGVLDLDTRLDPSIARSLLQAAERSGDEANIRKYRKLCERIGA